jgi:DNA helicase IV
VTLAHPALADEQEYLDMAYDLLERGMADAEASIAAAVPGDRASARALRRALEVLRQSKGTGALIFGRADAADATLYIGRRRVYDEQKNLKVISWHTQAAAPFYEATPGDPQGLTRKRTFVEEERRIVRLIDEVFGDAAASTLGGPTISDALLAEVERSRDGAMRDVVATIQAEQFRVIRAPTENLLVVQGGPGTGKTVVGLHRAAWLAYNNPALRERGMLVVAPSATLLSYISGVLPLLGVNDVLQVQLPDLYAGDGRATATDTPLAEAVKGSERMAAVLAAALRQRISVEPGDVELAVGPDRVRLPAAQVSALLDEVRRRSLPHNEARGVLKEMLGDALFEAYAAGQRSRGRPPVANDSTIRRLSAFSNALDRLWPTFSPEELLRTLYATRSWLVDAATDILTPDERAAIVRESTGPLAEVAWTEADLYCLDELSAMLDGQPVTYGHVVVDEAQDLSPMQARALARRCPTGSMTLLGDLAQARTTWAVDDWSQICRHLSDTRAHVETLTIGYRVPSSVLDLAARQLPLISSTLRAPESVRTGRLLPQVLREEPGMLVSAVESAIRHARTLDMTVGVVVEDGDYDDLLGGLRAHDPSVGDGRGGDFARPTTVVPARLAKGLEFDAVIVAEPGAIVGTSDDNRRILYAAMTRCTQALYIAHTRPLPLGLDDLDTTPSARPADDRADTSADSAVVDEVARAPRDHLLEIVAGLADDDIEVLLTMARRLMPKIPRNNS